MAGEAGAAGGAGGAGGVANNGAAAADLQAAFDSAIAQARETLIISTRGGADLNTLKKSIQ